MKILEHDTNIFTNIDLYVVLFASVKSKQMNTEFKEVKGSVDCMSIKCFKTLIYQKSYN
jgi:hypothetical protein